MLNCCKHNLCRAFVDGLIDNDEKVASSKYTQLKTRLQKPYPTSAVFMTKIAEINTLVMTKIAEKPLPCPIRYYYCSFTGFPAGIISVVLISQAVKSGR